MALTDEQLQALPEAVRAEVSRMQGQVANVEGYVKGIFANPEARKHFEKINALQPEALRIALPADPLDGYVAPLKAEITSLKGEIQKSNEEKQRDAIRAKMAQFDIPMSDIEKLGQFQSDNGISDPLKAIELYAKTVDREPAVVTHGPSNAHKFDKPPDEKTAMETAAEQIRNYNAQIGR